MKEATVHSLIIARTLLEQAETLCRVDDRYIASAGLVVLQDAVEVVFYALLIELGADEGKNLESKGFDELIGELKSAGVKVPKSGTLKAMNKQRVLTKHYAQVAEPITVRNYFDASLTAIESTVTAVTGNSLRALFIADLLPDSEAKAYLKAAEEKISKGEYMSALVETRKAIYVELEEQYNVYGWRDYQQDEPHAMTLGLLLRGGWSAPAWKRNRRWIAENVKRPTEYIQVDYEHMRLQAMEWGVHTAELHNVRRLTPAVFRTEKDAGWSLSYPAEFEANNATMENARYCLDRTVSILLKKGMHQGAMRRGATARPFDPPPFYLGQNVHEAPDTRSPVVHVVAEGFSYTVKSIAHGIDPAECFYEVWAESDEKDPASLLALSKEAYVGFLLQLPESPVPLSEPEPSSGDDPL